VKTFCRSLAGLFVAWSAAALAGDVAGPGNPSPTGATAPGAAFIADAELPPGTNYAVAAFRFWCPQEVRTVRGVAVLVPGSNGDGRPLVNDPFWQAFARQHELALTGCFFKDHPHEDMNIEEYARASAGSGQALLDALARFAREAARPEVAAAPVVFWGHSAGGEFNYEFACWQPGRVLAFVVNKGGYYFTHLAPASTRQVPGLFFIGERDEEFRSQSIRGIFAINRRAGARWVLAIEPKAGHEPGRTHELAATFFGAVLQARAREAGGPAWVGGLKTLEICVDAQAASAGAQTSWLPDEATARHWRRFMRGE